MAASLSRACRERRACRRSSRSRAGSRRRIRAPTGFRTRNPDGAFTSTFQGFANPGFQAYEEVDSIATPTFSVFGTVMGGPLVPSPTPPDFFGYVAWSTSYNNPWDFAISGIDSSTVYYWGFSAPLSIAPSASVTYAQYLTTQQGAIDVGPIVQNVVPTLTDWGIIALAALIGAAGLVSLRRRRPI